MKIRSFPLLIVLSIFSISTERYLGVGIIKKYLPIICLFSFLLFSCSKEKEQEQVLNTQKPNIIYVLADDLGYGDVGAFNENSKIKTPYLDKLANEGMMFTDAHSSSSVCTPTRYGILTGRYSWRSPLKHTVLDGRSIALIPPERTTVASILKTQGYHTAFIGKWHLGWDWATFDTTTIDIKDRPHYLEGVDYTKPITNGPNSLGFDYAYGHAASLDMPPFIYVENENITQVPSEISQDTSEYGWWRRGLRAKNFVHEQVTPNFFTRAGQYVKGQAKTNSPFFLYLALPSPHIPILPTDEWQGKSGLHPYADYVMMVDDYMGGLLNIVEEAGIAENTLIIFTSDNGFYHGSGKSEMEAQGHFPNYIYRGAKADVFEGGHRVPFIVRWPTKIKSQQVKNKPICTTDLMATVAEITGYTLANDEGEDSYSMLPLFSNNDEAFHRESTIYRSDKGLFAIRKGDWKLNLCRGSGGWSEPNKKTEGYELLPELQLYNLKNDPSESINVVEQQPEVTRELLNNFFSIVDNGRSTSGDNLQNDAPYKWYKSWYQLEDLKKFREASGID